VFQDAYDADTARMVVVNSDGTRRRRLVPKYWISTPAWSPDGRMILFAGAPPSPLRDWALYLTDAAGHKPHRIPGSAFDPVAYSNWSWSPDGERIFLLSETDDSNRGLELSVIPRRGGTLRKLSGDLNVNAFDVSRDGRQIALQASIGTKDSEIYVMNADGGNPRPITDNRAQDRDHTGRPTGDGSPSPANATATSMSTS
jgi:Tol biopolymer transport system component